MPMTPVLPRSVWRRCFIPWVAIGTGVLTLGQNSPQPNQLRALTTITSIAANPHAAAHAKPRNLRAN